MLKQSDDLILAFWAWFATVANALAEDLANETVHEVLDARLRELGAIAWELGPGLTAESALAISPDGDPRLLQLTQRIVALAPGVTGWEFHSSRQARAACWEFSIKTGNAHAIEVDARSWRYVLYKFPDEMFDIVIEQPNLADASDDDRYTAAVVLLDGLLGEGKRLLRIRDIEAVGALDPEQERNATVITLLAQHLETLW